jgi:hypothetical protein
VREREETVAVMMLTGGSHCRRGEGRERVPVRVLWRVGRGLDLVLG